jgi:hypothetical protein
MPERKDRLSRRPKVKEERVENQISADNQIKKKKSLGALRPIKRQNPDHPMRRVSFTFNVTRWRILPDN